MNSIVILNDTGRPVTTSLAIAEGVERPHKNIIELIRENIADLEAFGGVTFETRPFETPGGMQSREVAILNEHHATLLITFLRNIGIVKEFKKRLVKAFFEMRDELNKRQPPSAENLSRMDILKMALESESERVRLEQENREKEALIKAQQSNIIQLRPKADFADKVAIAPDAISVANAAKILGTGQRRLFAYLRRIGWVSRRNEPYQAKIEAGLLDVKLGNWSHPDHGLQQSVTALITGKGLQKLQELMATEGVSA
ncbi:hypothetical protein GJQ54_05430 [Oceanospirillaceae bacterium ASx5O]|nr:hypothetical protein GJQ54_05430 [Oceanospirillaceae bacterium ASx5O]